MIGIADGRGTFFQRFKDTLPNEAAHIVEGQRGVLFMVLVALHEFFDKCVQRDLPADHKLRDRCSEEFQAE